MQDHNGRYRRRRNGKPEAKSREEEQKLWLRGERLTAFMEMLWAHAQDEHNPHFKDWDRLFSHLETRMLNHEKNGNPRELHAGWIRDELGGPQPGYAEEVADAARRHFIKELACYVAEQGKLNWDRRIERPGAVEHARPVLK